MVSRRALFTQRLIPLGVLILYALTIYLRDPRFFSQPRFWAEEGSLHFAFSYSHGWFQSLFQPQLGYLNFWANLATKLATLAPLEDAPLVTTLLAFGVQLIPPGIILYSRSSLWSNWLRKLLAVLVFLFVPLTNEVWLNSVNSWTFFAVITCLILLEETPHQSIRKWVYCILLVLSGLTGALSCFLFPLFSLRAYLDKDRERVWQAAFIGFAGLVQAWFIYTAPSTRSFDQRFHLLGFASLGAAFWTQGLAYFYLGLDGAHQWAKQLLWSATYDLDTFQMMGRGLLFLGIVFLGCLSCNLNRMPRIVLIGSYALFLLVQLMFTAIADKYSLFITGDHQRLFLAPNTILALTLVQGIQFSQGWKWKSWMTRLVTVFCAVLLFSAVIHGINTYADPWWVVSDAPDWKREVQIWKADPSYRLQIQPSEWRVELKQR